MNHLSTCLPRESRIQGCRSKSRNLAPIGFPTPPLLPTIPELAQCRRRRRRRCSLSSSRQWIMRREKKKDGIENRRLGEESEKRIRGDDDHR